MVQTSKNTQYILEHLNDKLNAIVGNTTSQNDITFAMTALATVGTNAVAYLKSLLKNPSIKKKVITLVSRSNTVTNTSTVNIR